MTNRDNTILFQAGPLSVTQAMLRFRRRRYAIAQIENLVLKRPLFLMGLGTAALIIGMAVFNADILYVYEMGIAVILALGLAAASWPWGTLYIHSKLLRTSDGAITWLHADLIRSQDIVERMIENRRTPGGFYDGEGSANADDDNMETGDDE